MKEQISKKVVTNEIDEVIKTMSIFDWKIIDKNIMGYYSRLIFEREKETPYYNEITSLEKKWNKETTFPSWPTYVFVLLSLAFITAYLIILLNSKNEEGKLVFNLLHFLLIMLPGIIFLSLSAIYSYIRIKKLQNIIINYYEKRREYALMINKIKEEENK